MYLKSVKCPHCAVVLYKKNLLVHIQRKNGNQPDIIVACHSKSKSVSKAYGLFDFPKGIHVWLGGLSCLKQQWGLYSGSLTVCGEKHSRKFADTCVFHTELIIFWSLYYNFLFRGNSTYFLHFIKGALFGSQFHIILGLLCLHLTSSDWLPITSIRFEQQLDGASLWLRWSYLDIHSHWHHTDPKV